MNRNRSVKTGFPEPHDGAAAARLIESFGALSLRAQRVARSARGRAALAALGGHAPYLAMLALREPDIVIRLLRRRG